MTEQVQQQPQGNDAVKLTLAPLAVVAGFVAFYYFSAQPVWVRWLMVLAAFVAGVAIGLQSLAGKQLWQFVQSARIELRKVVWPTRQESMQVTALVFVVIVVLGLFFWGLDAALLSLTQWLTGRSA